MIVADRLVAGAAADLGDQLLGQRLGQGVDDQHAVVADLHGGVDAAAGQHPDVALDVERLHLRGAGVAGAATAGRPRPVRSIDGAPTTSAARHHAPHPP